MEKEFNFMMMFASYSGINWKVSVKLLFSVTYKCSW